MFVWLVELGYVLLMCYVYVFGVGDVRGMVLGDCLM